MSNLVGNGLNQVPTNSMLGGLAYQDPEYASIKDLDLKNLSQINSEIDDTAVDVFVYDTRKDSDGGAWRKRTQHTSWYNETLGTSTRGTRREFPAVAVIVSESDTLTIYDGDDPDLPMWMVFTTTGTVTANAIVRTSGYDISTVSMLNGLLVCGVNYNGGFETNFVSDKCHRRNPSVYAFGGNVASRNGGMSFVTLNTTAVTVNSTVNDVAMTVLPNAPIDDTTGLPVPTIAVGTDGGVSVIRDNGSVFDLTYQEASNRIVRMIDIDSNGRIYWSTRETGSAPGVYFHEADLPAADSSAEPPVNISCHQAGTANGVKPTLISGSIRDVVRTKDRTVISMSGNDNKAHLNLYNVTGDVNSSGSVDNFEMVDISTDYNTGYIIGDIKGAFLSDTDATNATDSNVVTNGTFDSNTSGWFGDSGASISWDSGGFASVGNGGGDNTFAIAQSGILVSGAKYRVTGRVQPSMSGSYEFRVRAGGASTQWNKTSGLTNGAWSNFDTGIITADGTVLEIGSNGGTITNFYLDDVYVWKLEEEDRSVNNTGLEVHGTITKSAVATGAELVAYSGFNSSNYLFQPYNSDLDFTNTMMIMLWVKGWESSDDLLHRGPNQTRNSQTSFALYCDGGYDYRLILSSNGTSEQSFEILLDTNLSGWQHLCFTLSGGVVRGFLNGEEKTLNNSTFTGTVYSGAPGLNGLWIGRGPVSGYPVNASIALLRLSESAPSSEQIKKIYEDEKVLFQENAKATLYGSPGNVTAIAYDDSTNLLYAGTAAGRSEFQGICRINNTTTAVTTAISASNGLVAEQ